MRTANVLQGWSHAACNDLIRLKGQHIDAISYAAATTSRHVIGMAPDQHQQGLHVLSLHGGALHGEVTVDKPEQVVLCSILQAARRTSKAQLLA